ncbi:helicase C-terminal domain-containing protein [Schizophyllum commune]
MSTNAETSLVLPTPSEFPSFPYPQPYQIQLDLMRHLYEVLESKKISIVESPTGTGKTLSLLTASLTWLRDHQDRARKAHALEVTGNAKKSTPQWAIDQAVARKKRELEAREEEREERMKKARAKEAKLRAKVVHMKKKQKVEGAEGSKTKSSINEARYLPSDDEDAEDEDGMSKEVRALFAKYVLASRNTSRITEEDEEALKCTKIYYASRTHSQLSQVLPELRRVDERRACSSASDDSQPKNTNEKFARDCGKRPRDEDDEVQYFATTRAVALGSRKQLCINDTLLKGKRVDLDEACRAMLAEKKEKRCPHLPSQEEEAAMLDLRDQILATPKDIEELAATGRASGICPYFGSRKAIDQAELVTLPYNLLFQKSAREALGIDLKDQIVVIDEAHNVIPTLLSLSTTSLPLSQIRLSLAQVTTYLAKFKTRLKHVHVLSLRRLTVFLESLVACVEGWGGGEGVVSEIMTPNDFVSRLGKKVEGINLLEVERYLKASRIARKISGYCLELEEVEGEEELGAGKVDRERKREKRKGMVPPLHAVEDFMVSLSGMNDDGRISFIRNTNGSLEVRYQLLNPEPNFAEVVDEARAVVLAGGTMSPMSDVFNQLFSHVAAERLTSFSCGHIIPANNLQTLVVTKGPKGGPLEFKAERQKDPAAIEELGQVLFNLVCVTPKGMAVFFPSYNFLNAAKAAWGQSGTLGRLEGRKKIFFEPEETTDVDKVLQSYATAVHEVDPARPKPGALLFAVIGAKLSEGLNFADDLARSVVIIGMPYANLGSAELKERMAYVKRLEERRVREGKQVREKGAKDAAAELYENMCMNAVNQSIGRAIRHQGDWAALVLLDRRYANNTAIRNKLPKWIGSGLTVADTYGMVIKELATFYRQKTAA